MNANQKHHPPASMPRMWPRSAQRQPLERLHLLELHQIVEQSVTQQLRGASCNAVELFVQLLGRERRLRATEPAVDLAAKRASVLERDVEAGAPALDGVSGRNLDRLRQRPHAWIAHDLI